MMECTIADGNAAHRPDQSEARPEEGYVPPTAAARDGASLLDGDDGIGTDRATPDKDDIDPVTAPSLYVRRGWRRSLYDRSHRCGEALHCRCTATHCRAGGGAVDSRRGS